MAEDIKYLVRVAGKDLDGTKPVRHAITRVKGIDSSMANAIVRVLEFDPMKQLGAFSDDDIDKIKKTVDSPSEAGIPSWLVNRRKDWKTGDNVHMVAADLELSTKRDIDRMKDIRCRKGIRHSLGLKVRGQRTKSNGRTGGAVGVSRKKLARRLAKEKAEKEE